MERVSENYILSLEPSRFAPGATGAGDSPCPHGQGLGMGGVSNKGTGGPGATFLLFSIPAYQFFSNTYFAIEEGCNSHSAARSSPIQLTLTTPPHHESYSETVSVAETASKEFLAQGSQEGSK